MSDPGGFIHSVRVRRSYKIASSILKSVSVDRGSLKGLISKVNRREKIQAVSSLVSKALKNKTVLEKILKETGILEAEKRLDPWLARILITELVFGKKKIFGKSKPETVVLSYKEKIKDSLKGVPLKESQKRSEALGWLFLYSVAMFSLPFLAFFGVRHCLDNYGVTGFANTAWSVVASVVVVYLIIASYVIKAWHEQDPDRREPQKED